MDPLWESAPFWCQGFRVLVASPRTPSHVAYQDWESNHLPSGFQDNCYTHWAIMQPLTSDTGDNYDNMVTLNTFVLSNMSKKL